MLDEDVCVGRMTCSELEPLLDPYLDGEFTSADSIDLERHLSRCAACAGRVQGLLSEREALRAKLHESMNSTLAPSSLRTSVVSGLRDERRRLVRVQWAKGSAAAALVVLTGVAWWHWRPSPTRRFLEDAALWHAKSLPVEINGKNHEVEAWFGGKLDHRVTVPQLPNTTLAGARLSNVRDRPAAYISYDAALPSQQRRRVGLFVFDDATDEVDAPELPQVQMASSHGYNVALWRDGEIVYELVSDLDERDIRQMVVDRAAQRPDLRIEPASLRQ